MINISIEKFYSDLITNSINYEIPDEKNYKDLYNFFIFYKELKKVFESNIEKVNDSFKDESDNKLVRDLVDEFIRMNKDGKYVRAFLIALGYLSFSDKEDDSYLKLALAYETFQTAILIHDDIIDNASERRGKITIPQKFIDNNKYKDAKHIGDSLGLCVGDLGFYLTNQVIIDNYKDNKEFANIFKVYNDIVIKTAKGEILDTLLPFKQKNENSFEVSEEDVFEIYRLKTAWYTVIGPFYLGMTLSGCDNRFKDKLYDVLYNLGVAFQIKDDIMGIFSSEEELGKTASDISEFKQTILYTYVAKNKDYLDELNKYYGKEQLTKEEVEKVRSIFRESGAYDYSNNVMEKLFDESKKQLDKISFKNEKYKSILSGFITYLYLRNK